MYCCAEEQSGPAININHLNALQVLWSITGPTITVSLEPFSCEITTNANTEQRALGLCKPAELVIKVTPGQLLVSFCCAVQTQPVCQQTACMPAKSTLP